MQELNFFNEEIEYILPKEAEVVSWINKTIESEEKIPGEINIIFCSDEYLLSVNREYLDHDYYTDIITFDYCVEDIVSGDLFISVDRVNENAEEQKVDAFEEMKRIIIHGVLHLLGYKDKEPQQKQQMTQKEDFYLSEF